MMSTLLLAFALAQLNRAASGALHLTKENYDEITAGKTVFLKMYAPWVSGGR